MSTAEDTEFVEERPASPATPEGTGVGAACSENSPDGVTTEAGNKRFILDILCATQDSNNGGVKLKRETAPELLPSGGRFTMRGNGSPGLPHHGRRYHSVKSSQSNTARSSSFPVKGGNWLLGTQARVVGLGTTGLYENERKREEDDVPEGGSAMINGQLVVAPSCCIRRLRDLAMWRDRHRDFIASFRAQDPLERVNSHRRQQRRTEERHREQEKEYADEVSRIRQRGKWLTKVPQPVDAERQQWLRSRREALQAGRDGVVLNNMKKGAELREDIAKQLVAVKQVRQQQELAARSVARQERTLQDARREEMQSSIEEKTRVARSDRDTWREYIQDFKNEEKKNRRQYLDQLRCRVLTKTVTEYRDGDGGLTPTGRPLSAPACDNDKPHLDSTHRPVLAARQGAGSGMFRRQLLAELQQQRLEGARAAADLVRADRSTARRIEALRDNCNRAESLRGERGVLQERKQRQDRERSETHSVLREEHALERRQKDAAVQRMLEEKRENAAAIRQAAQWTEAEHQSHEQEMLQKMRERASHARFYPSRGLPLSVTRGGQRRSWRAPEVLS